METCRPSSHCIKMASKATGFPQCLGISSGDPGPISRVYQLWARNCPGSFPSPALLGMGPTGNE